MLLEGRAGQAGIKRCPPSQKILGAQVSQSQVGVGNRWLVSAFAVAGRTGVSPGAVRADTQDAARIDARDAPTAGAERVYVDHRNGDLPARLELLVGHMRGAVLDQRDVGARAPHVEADDFGLAKQLAVASRAAHPAGRARQDGSNGLPD